MKRNAATELGIDFKHITLAQEATIDQVISTVNELNQDASISGILVQLPLGPHIDTVGERTVIASIDPGKDVDGQVSCFTLVFESSTTHPQIPSHQHWESMFACFIPSFLTLHPRRYHQAPRGCPGSDRRGACSGTWPFRYRRKPCCRNASP